MKALRTGTNTQKKYRCQDFEKGQTTARAVGGYSERVHLFPFRTEKLSRSALMVLPLGGRVGRCQLNTTLYKARSR